MAPPCFADFGKQTRDLFSKNYCIGVVKLDCKTKTDSGVHFSVSGTSQNDTGAVNAHMETKYTVKDYGLTIKEKWTTNNTLASELSIEDQFTKGLKLSAESNFAPNAGRMSGLVKGVYKNDHFHLNTDVQLDEAGPRVHSAGVIHYQGWLTGGQVSFDVGQGQLTRSSFGIGYEQRDFVFHSSMTNVQDFSGYMHQKVNDKLESGMQLTWSASNNITNFALGCVYKLDKDTSVRAKINNNSQIGLSFTHHLRKGINLTLSTLIDGKNINQGGHKIGLGLELEG